MDIESEYSLKHSRRVKKIKNNKTIGDSVSIVKQKTQTTDVLDLHHIILENRQKNTQTLLLKGGRTDFFVTEDSHRYISPTQQYKKDQSYDYIDPRGYFDSVHFRYIKQYNASELQQNRLVAEFRNAKDVAINFREALRLDLSPIRMWQVSLAGAVLFGMVSMSMIYKNLGQSAFAKGVEEAVAGTNDKVVALTVGNAKEGVENIKKQVKEKKEDKAKKEKKDVEAVVENVAKEKEIEKQQDSEIQKTVDGMQQKENVKIETKKEIENIKEEKKVEKKSVDSIQKKEENKSNTNEKKKEKEEKKKEDTFKESESEYSLEYAAYELVDGYPIEKMLPYILQQDPEVAKYLIAMAKQESAWGKRVPVLNGQDCYNYWGYRGKRKLMGSGGHTCFNSRKDAVETVGKRLHELIYDYDRKTPEKLIVWKCGSSCAGHSQEGVDRWINTIKSNYNKLSDVKTVSKK